MPVKKITPEVQAFIVEAVAYNAKPTRVVAMVRETFKVKVSPTAVEHYDPTKVSGRSLAEDLKELFWKHRTTFIAECEKVAESNKMVRVAELSGIYAEARDVGNSAEARAALEQIAKEMGGIYTNTRVHELAARDGAGPVLNINLTGLVSPPGAPADVIDGSEPTPETE